MRNMTLGVFGTRADAERAIGRLVKEQNVPMEQISFMYRDETNDGDRVVEERADAPNGVDGDRVAPVARGAGAGAGVGAVLGGIAGAAVAAGVMPFLAPLIVAGPLAAALGLTGAAATVTAGALTGAAVGALAGALVKLGVPAEKAEVYEREVSAGKTLLAVGAQETGVVEDIMNQCGATNVETFTVEA